MRNEGSGTKVPKTTQTHGLGGLAAEKGLRKEGGGNTKQQHKAPN